MVDQALEKLINAVEAHYATDNAPPLLLSAFGQKNKELLAELKGVFGSLKSAISAAGENRIRFIDKTVGREAIAPPAIAEGLQNQIREDTVAQRESVSLFDSLPLSVRLAFCVRTEGDELVALDTSRPFRYTKVTAPELLRSTQRIIASHYRRPGLALATASMGEREALWRSFLTWSEEAGVDPSTFRQRDATTALSRLIAAQPADVIPRLIIPGDIAAILLKHA